MPIAGTLEHPLQLRLRRMGIVEQDQLRVLKASPNFRFGRRADLVGLVEGFEDELQKIVGRLTTDRQ